MKTLIYIGGFEFPDKNAAALRVLSIGKILRLIGFRVVFVGVSKNKNLSNNVLLTKKFHQDFIYYEIAYPDTVFQWCNIMYNISSYIKVANELDNVSAFVCYNFPSIALSRLNKYCNGKGVKCYADVTEWYSGAGRSFFNKIVKTMDTWMRMYIVHKKLDGLIVISRYLEKYYENKTKVVYIPAAVDLNEQKWKNDYIKNKDILKLVYAGNPGRKDRIDYLVEALRRVTINFHLDVVGITEEEYISMYPQHKEFLKNNYNIKFYEKKEHIETLEYVKKADFSCFFRDIDIVSKAGFPTKLAEAITCGTAVLTNRTSNISEYVHDNLNGIMLVNNNVEEISQILEKTDHNYVITKEIFDYRQYKNTMEIFILDKK